MYTIKFTGEFKRQMKMIQASFGGYDNVYECYTNAVKHGYKFGCFGDALLIVDD